MEPMNHDRRFDPVVSQFKKDAEFFGRPISSDIIVAVKFGDLNRKLKYAGLVPLNKSISDAAGVCYNFQKQTNDLKRAVGKLALGKKFSRRLVIISNDYKKSPPPVIEAIVYHELGHCLLDLEHRENQVIMNTAGPLDLGGFRYFHLRELFTNESTPLDMISNPEHDDSSLELIYQTNYEFMDEKIFHQTYYSQKHKRFYFKDNYQY